MKIILLHMATRWALGLILCLVSYATACAQTVLQLSTTRSISTTGHLQMLRDSSNGYTPEQAASSSSWKELAGPLNAGYTSDFIWLRIYIQRPADGAQHWLLQFSHALLDDAVVFRRNEGGKWIAAGRSGENMGRENWPVKTRNPVFPITLESDERTEVLIRLQSKNAMSLYLTLSPPSAYVEETQWEYLAYGIGFGFGLLLLIFHSLFWHVARETLSAWYLLYVASAISVEALTVGLPQQYFEMPVAISDPLLGVLLSISLSIGVRFWLLQLDLEVRWPNFSRRLLGTSLVISVAGCMLVLGGRMGIGMQLVQCFALVMIVLYVTICAYLFNKDEGQAKTFLLIFGVYYASVLISFLRNMGWVSVSAWTNNAVAIGAGVHMLLMSFRLNRRYDKLRREKDAAQQRIVEVVTRQNEWLEGAVRSRTEKLLREIARREQLEHELRSALETERLAKQSQMDFVAMVSHEFRTPLAVISTTAQQIARNVDALREKTLTRCANLRAAVQRLTSLVDEYLTVDRMDTGRQAFRPRRHSPQETNEFLDALVNEWPQSRVIRKDICVPEVLWCDRGLMQVALRNLLANADRHTPPAGAIELSVDASSKTFMSFRVCNPGQPIFSDDVPRLFEKYFRGRNSLHAPGAGLGLHLVRQIAELHGGQACLEDSGRDGLVVFRIDVPLQHVEATSTVLTSALPV